MKRISLATLAGAIVVASPALADNIPVEAPIQLVVVYPQGALIGRGLSFELPRGTSVLVVDDLPTSIDAGSIRVQGLNGVGAEIQSVVVRSGKTGDDDLDPVRTRILEEIEALNDHQDVLSDHRVALEAQRAFIENLIAQGPAGFGQLLGEGGGGIEQWPAGWTMIGAGIAGVQADLRQMAFEQREVAERIDELLDELAGLPTATPHLEILIEIAAATPTSGTLELNYLVASARWAPAYDAELATTDDDGGPSIELIRRAEIIQNTGEDWVDVAVTLSTNRPSGGTQAPQVGEAIIVAYDQERRLADAAPAAEAARIDDGNVPAGLLLAEAEAVADFGDFKADYVIPTPVTVESGGGTRSVRITTERALARLFVEASPRISEQAFLTAAFSIDSQAPILAGRVNLFRDDAYVGTGRLAFANPGDELTLGFGPDDLVRVTWTLVNRSTGERGLLTRVAFDEREYLATIINDHERSIEIIVVDRVPVSDDERVTVSILPQSTVPTHENVDGRRGVYAWSYDYEAGETREIINAYVVSWPADLTIFGD